MKSKSVTIQMKAKYFPLVLFIMKYFSLVVFVLKNMDQYFPVVLFIMLYNVALTFEYVDEIQKCERSINMKATRLYKGIL